MAALPRALAQLSFWRMKESCSVVEASFGQKMPVFQSGGRSSAEAGLTAMAGPLHN
jgi:hypothetical protein